MSKFIIKDDFWDIFPETEISIILAKGITNKEEDLKDKREEITNLLKDANHKAMAFITSDIFSENQVVSVWRKAFQKFKTKKGVRCSIENLLKRIEKGNEVGTINPLVDIYNAVSLIYAIPCGGEDLDTFDGDLILTKADGGESFMALGDEDFDNALPEEIIYKDNIGAVCRCWNWRDGQRTMLTEKTVNAFMIIESVDPSRHEDVIAATELLAGLIKKYLGGTAEIQYLNIKNKQIDL